MAQPDMLHRLVVAADRDLRTATGRLASARPHLAPAIRTAEAERGRAGVERAKETLNNACRSLGAALSSMGAVEILNEFIHDGLLDGEARVIDLRPAMARAEAAHHHVVACCGHLAEATRLLDHPGVPRVDAVIDAERLSAARNLEAALQETSGARQLVTGIN